MIQTLSDPTYGGTEVGCFKSQCTNHFDVERSFIYVKESNLSGGGGFFSGNFLFVSQSYLYRFVLVLRIKLNTKTKVSRSNKLR